MTQAGLLHGIRAIAFDLDNTLYDKETFARGAYRRMARYLASTRSVSVNAVFDALDRSSRKLGSNHPRLFEHALKKFAIRDEVVIRRLVGVYRRHAPRSLPLYPGARALVRRLSEKYALAVITDGYPATQRNKLRALGIRRYFSTIVYTQALGGGKKFRKPHPLAYETAIRRFRLRPTELLYVGDNPRVDFAGALAAGVRCVRVQTGEFGRTRLPGAMRRSVLEVRDIRKLSGKIR